ncbi:endonuclease III [Candidatus Borrarchaeum sp.]|uniref:endonuclease III domain-containing protein n=1 Tax=Candidatus Borrarchaeum sp. TaxID=2846742 RepID=UPI00257B66D4|nr:endonuclease III [Candidatus Borrarchaeum sp.]
MQRKKWAKEIAERLIKEYGQNRKESLEPFDELIRTILSQNTSDVNSERSYKQLAEKFSTVKALATASLNEIEEAIKIGGLYRQKAKRIKSIAQLVLEKYISLSFLKDMNTDEVRKFLNNIDGVGAKTADCVLLFSLKRPVIPVDTHVWRVSKRLGLVKDKKSKKVTREMAGRVLEKLIESDLRYDFHVDLILHGRKICKAQIPLCKKCILEDLCEKNGVKNKG